MFYCRAGNLEKSFASNDYMPLLMTVYFAGIVLVTSSVE